MNQFRLFSFYSPYGLSSLQHLFDDTRLYEEYAVIISKDHVAIVDTEIVPLSGREIIAHPLIKSTRPSWV